MNNIFPLGSEMRVSWRPIIDRDWPVRSSIIASNLVGTEIPLTLRVAKDIQFDVLERVGDDVESVK